MEAATIFPTARPGSGKLRTVERSRSTNRAERRLAARLRRRDPRAVEELYERYGRLTFGYLVRVLADAAAAEDVQQQVFLEVWQRGPAYDPGRASLATWIMTIVRSRAVDHLRRRVPEPRGGVGTDPALAVLEAGEGDAGLAELHDRWWLAATLADLPEIERDVLRLRFADGLSQAEIAEALGIPLGTVKTRMLRGLERLRARVEAER
jgi:RNA polymerase sigma-70 factor, ECF subfamily